MTQHNLTQILKVIRDLVMRNRPCYRDYLGTETTTKMVQIGAGTFGDNSGRAMVAFRATDPAFTGFVLGETYTVTIDGVTADYVARNFLPVSDEVGPIIGTITTYNEGDGTFDGWFAMAGLQEGAVICVAQTFDMSFAGKTIFISQTKTETVKRYNTKLLPEYLLPAFLRKNVVASKTEVQSAVANAVAAADNAQTTADNAQSTATAAQSEIDLVNTKLQYVVNVTPQSLSDIQKTTARSNIGASDGNYNNLENAPCFSKNEATNYEQVDGDMGTSLHTDAKKLFLSRKNVLLGKRLTAETLASFEGVTSTSAILFKSDYSKPQVIENLIYQGVPTLAWGNLSLIRPSLTNTGEDWCVVVRTDTYYFYYWAQADNRCQFIYESILEHKLKQLDDSLIPDTIQRVPIGGTAGQLLGKTESGTAWIDPPQSGVQPDWNQNDSTALDYVKNRPFYTGDPVETVFVEESTVSFVDNGGKYVAEFPSTFSATVGETYKVYWDGSAYECICVDFPSRGLAMGNLSIPGVGSDTGEPFFVNVINGKGMIIYTADTSASHTFSISGLVSETVKVDEKYLPTITADKLPEIPADKLPQIPADKLPTIPIIEFTTSIWSNIANTTQPSFTVSNLSYSEIYSVVEKGNFQIKDSDGNNYRPIKCKIDTSGTISITIMVVGSPMNCAILVCSANQTRFYRDGWWQIEATHK